TYNDVNGWPNPGAHAGMSVIVNASGFNPTARSFQVLAAQFDYSTGNPVVADLSLVFDLSGNGTHWSGEVKINHASAPQFDTIVENANEGIDTVQTALSYTLPANVENLVLTGSGNVDGTGNSGNNVLTGNGGNNTLAGGGGFDTVLYGGIARQYALS